MSIRTITSYQIEVELPAETSEEIFKALWAREWREENWEEYGRADDSIEYRLWENFLEAAESVLESGVLSELAHENLDEIHGNIMYSEHEAPVTVFRAEWN